MTHSLSLFSTDDSVLEERPFTLLEAALGGNYQEVRSILAKLKKDERLTAILESGFSFSGNGSVSECMGLVFDQINNGSLLRRAVSIDKESGVISIRGNRFGPSKKDVVDSLFLSGATLDGHYQQKGDVFTFFSGRGNMVYRISKIDGAWLVERLVERLVESNNALDDIGDIETLIQVAFKAAVDS